jgi:putative transposase
MVMRAIEMVFWQCRVQNNLVFHSYRKTQITSGDYQRLLKHEHLTSSMRAVGGDADHAVLERLFGVLKPERINYRQCRTRDEASANT